ncbi:MAG: Sec-independent protein translocase protein TatB [Pseudomonadota bacterium]
MLDVAPTELLLVAVVAVVVIGPKDLPRAMRFVGHWMGRARGVARQFRSGFDEMVRESELADMEKKWAEENARIMSAHPTPSVALPAPDAVDASPLLTVQPAIVDDGAVVDHPAVEAAPEAATEPEPTKAPS